MSSKETPERRRGRVDERLEARAVALLTEETPATPRHNATVEVFEPGESGFDFAELQTLVVDRLAFVPRYRQRIAGVPRLLGTPRWVDDDRFELDYHVRRLALPRPGTSEQLQELVSRIVSRPLDRDRPLWEMYVVEGLAQDRFAVLTKTHQALVDGVHTVDLAQILYEDRPVSPVLGGDGDGLSDDAAWDPRPPSRPALLMSAAGDLAGDLVRDPRTAAGLARSLSGSAWRRASAVADTAGGVVRELTGRPAEPSTPLTGELSKQRLVEVLGTPLSNFRQIRDAHGGTINDVILAVVTGGLRGWLLTRAESLSRMRRLPALVPVSVIDDDLAPTSLGTQIAAHFVELPVGEASAAIRLHQVSYSFESFVRHQPVRARTVGADRLAGLTGFAPATFHALGSRLAAAERGYALSVTNVPGPQQPRYAGGARLVASYPLHPLVSGHALAIGVTSYDGQVFFGITADRDLVPDVKVLRQSLADALDELGDSAIAIRHRPGTARPPRSRPARPRKDRS